MAVVEDAIIVAGGIGSRMLPVSAMIPKEALPLVDIPAIAHLAREAIHAGVKRIHIISSPSKDFSKILSDNSWIASTREELDEAANKVFEMASSGKVKIKISKKYSLKDIAQAHKDLESRVLTGPAVILP